MKFSAATLDNDHREISLVSLKPLQFIHPLLSFPFIPPTSAYTLVSTWAGYLQWEGRMEPLMTWLRDTLMPSFPAVESLTPLDMECHVTIGKKWLLQQVVPKRVYNMAEWVKTIIVDPHYLFSNIPIQYEGYDTGVVHGIEGYYPFSVTLEIWLITITLLLGLFLW